MTAISSRDPALTHAYLHRWVGPSYIKSRRGIADRHVELNHALDFFGGGFVRSGNSLRAEQSALNITDDKRHSAVSIFKAISPLPRHRNGTREAMWEYNQRAE